ncbi:hypothetical protein KCP78_08780 [Salmonella enterica subsp. enterica]|nr:hypothetical protein KCP78_08780 [Salmonella enterica subsp. enterica]
MLIGLRRHSPARLALRTSSKASFVKVRHHCCCSFPGYGENQALRHHSALSLHLPDATACWRVADNLRGFLEHSSEQRLFTRNVNGFNDRDSGAKSTLS